MITKREKAMRKALSLWQFANHMDARNDKPWGMDVYQFWFSSGPRQFKTTAEIREMAKKIARSAK